MPARNSIKEFVPNSYYHLYNRGVDKRTIFVNPQDYAVFLSYLKTYLLPKDEVQLYSVISDSTADWREKDKALKLLRMNNFAGIIDLLAYCLMPNHFHLLIKQTDADGIDRFMNSLGTRYTMYFNKKHKRVGPLFQGLYKAVPITTDEQLLHLSRYIHRNPASQGTSLQSYSHSSYPEYLTIAKSEWVKTDQIISFFAKSGFNSYKQFVEDITLEDTSREYIRTVILEEE